MAPSTDCSASRLCGGAIAPAEAPPAPLVVETELIGPRSVGPRARRAAERFRNTREEKLWRSCANRCSHGGRRLERPEAARARAAGRGALLARGALFLGDD